MYFRKDEKVFSLAGTHGVVQRTNLKSLWGEFLCYLTVAGLYSECITDKNLQLGHTNTISSSGFGLGMGTYNYKLGMNIAEGLRERFFAIKNHADTNSKEYTLLENLDSVFDMSQKVSKSIKGKDFVQIAEARDLSDDMIAIARYVGVMLGQSSFSGSAMVPRMYLSLFGNIHLSKEDAFLLDSPKWVYEEQTDFCYRVSPLLAMMSASVDSLSEFDTPAELMCDIIGSMTFLSDARTWEQKIPLPYALKKSYMANTMGVTHLGSSPVQHKFLSEFLCGGFKATGINNLPALHKLVDLMGESTGLSCRSDMFRMNSQYIRIMATDQVSVETPVACTYLESALEALDDTSGETDDIVDTNPTDDSADTDSAEDDTVTDVDSEPIPDPSTQVGGYDPSQPMPAVPSSEESPEKDTIGLISFDKASEGIDEDLYRRVVVALNDRLQSDGSAPITAQKKEALNTWVNGYLYRAAISETRRTSAEYFEERVIPNVSH